MTPRDTEVLLSEPLSIDALIGWERLFTDEERMVRESVGRFVRERCMPRIADDFERGRFATELIPEIAALGILGGNLEGYGCAGLSSVAYGLACHELETCDSGLRSFVSVQSSLAMYAIHRFGSEAQKARWLPEMAAGRIIGCFGLSEPEAGSDPGSLTTRATRDGADWVLSGTKMWITNAQLADVAVVWAKSGPDPDSIVGFVVERGMKGFSAIDIPHKLSMRASATGGLVLDDVRIPEANRFPEAQGLRAPLACLNNARFGVGFGVLGAARFCLERAIDYARTRRQFGGPIARKQLVQKELAEMTSEVVKASLLAVHFARLKDEGRLHPAQVSLMKRNNCRIALDAARRARSLLGANGITGEFHVQRHAMNLESTYTYEGTDEIHALIVGRAVTGYDAF
jgi:glutaryl-CoA dehydrogenase